MPEPKQITLFVITTGKYKQFFPQLLEGVKNYFLVDHDITIELFTDEILKYVGDERVKVKKTLIVSYKFPFATLYRYKIFCSKEYKSDYLFYIDVDMSIVDFVGDEILGDLVAVRHPGFYNEGGSWETNPKSMCFTEPEHRNKYWAGGFQGGANEVYYQKMMFMRNLIDADERNGIIPIWNDESAWNFVLSTYPNIHELNPSYVMVEQKHLREAWGITQFPEKIIALEKQHEEIRS